MRNRLTALLTLTAVVLVMMSWTTVGTPASAAPSTAYGTGGTSKTTGGDGPNPAPDPPPECPYVPIPGMGSLAILANALVTYSPDPSKPATKVVAYSDVGGLLVQTLPSGDMLVLAKNCDGLVKYIPWGGAKPDPKQFEEEVKVEAGESIDPPGAAVNPAGRAPVNLGLWLAAKPDPTRPAIAETPDGSVWWRVDASMVDVTFDMGNGDRRTCTVWDREYQESDNTKDESPTCGYTYEGSEVVDRTDLEITVVARYRLSWSNSNGEAGNYPPSDDVCATTRVPYDVYELKTVPGSGSTTTFPPAPPPVPLNDVYTCPGFLPARG